MSPNNFDHVSRGRGNPAVSVPHYGERHGQAIQPKGDQFSGRNLGMIPKWNHLIKGCRRMSKHGFTCRTVAWCWFPWWFPGGLCQQVPAWWQAPPLTPCGLPCTRTHKPWNNRKHWLRCEFLPLPLLITCGLPRTQTHKHWNNRQQRLRCEFLPLPLLITCGLPCTQTHMP